MFGFNISRAQTSLYTESFETDGDGTRYESNFFTDFCGNPDWYRRMLSTDCNPPVANDNMAFTISGIDGSYFIAGDDVEQSPENPLGSGEAAYVTTTTINVSAYDEITVTVAVAANDAQNFENDRPIIDALFVQYAFDGNIATGANSDGALPSEGNLNTGTYSNAIAFYADGPLTYGGAGDLQEDSDLNGTPDGSLMSTTLSDFTGTFNTGGATRMSVRVVIRTDQGGEDVAFDNIRITGQTTLPITLSSFDAHAVPNGLSLRWKTESEINAKGIMVESSYKGAPFQDVQWVAAKGTDGKGAEYQVQLADMPAGEYSLRLRMEDWDGSKEWSSTRSLRIVNENSWEVYTSYEFLHISQLNSAAAFRFNLYDLSGKLHKELKLSGQENKVTLDASLPGGVYFFTIKDEKGQAYRSRIFIP